MRDSARAIHRALLTYDRARTVDGAQRILDQGGWCVYEVCLDVPHQVWEPHELIFHLVADAAADAIEAEIDAEPEYDGRITGCHRATLQPAAEMGTYLCYVASPRAALGLRTQVATP